MFGVYVRRTWKHDPTIYAPARYRRTCGYDAFIPDPIASRNFDLSTELAGVVSDAEAAVRALNARDMPAPAPAPLARLLLRTEAVASSKVEGMQVDPWSLARAEARSDLGGKASPTVLEVLANIDAMVLAVEDAAAQQAVSVEHIVAIHRVLLVDSSPETAGRIRREQNWIGGNDHNPCGAAYVPPPPEDVDRLLQDLSVFCCEEHLPPLIQAAMAHAQFETIHPFAHGNGRTGRALIQVILRRRGLAPAYVPPASLALANDTEGYIRGLVAYREGDMAAWLERFAVAAAQAASWAAQYLVVVGALQARWREQLGHVGTRPPRADAVSWALVDLLPGHPVLTLPVAVALTGRTKAAVNAGLAQLVAAGVLRPLTAGARNRAWEAVGLLDLLADAEIPSGRSIQA
jgi:Fic family protein